MSLRPLPAEGRAASRAAARTTSFAVNRVLTAVKRSRAPWKGAMRSEKAIQDAIRKALRDEGWLVAKAHGNRFQKGWPDLWCFHPIYGYRWIEVKRPDEGKLTKDQRRRFPEWAHYGVGIWVLTSETEIPLIWERPNWDQWL